MKKERERAYLFLLLVGQTTQCMKPSLGAQRSLARPSSATAVGLMGLPRTQDGEVLGIEVAFRKGQKQRWIPDA